MTATFSTSFPTWLLQPTMLENIINNPFAPLSDIPSALNLTEFPHFMPGLKQALFWRRRLSASASTKTVIFSFLGVRGLVLPKILEVCKALKSVCNMSSLVEVYRAPNSPFIGISFSNPAEIIKFQTLHSFNNLLVFHVSATSSLTHHFKLQGLPPLFPDSRIHHFISKHSVQHHFIRDMILTDDHTSTPSNSVTGTLLLSQHQDPAKIPHLIPLPAPHLGSALFILSGRQPLCLRCGIIGHIRRSCPSTKCSSCHRFHLISTSCPPPDSSSASDSSDSWMFSDHPSSSSTLISSAICVSSQECGRTRHSSSPADLSSPPILPALAVTSHLNPSPEIQPMHSASSAPSSHSSHLVLDSASTFINKKQGKRAFSSTKRSRPASTSSTHDLLSSNVFTHLIDEASFISIDTISHKAAPPSGITSDLLATASSTPLLDIPVSLDDDHLDVPHSPSNITSIHKRVKLHASTHTATMSSTTQSLAPSPIAPASSWGDRMDVEAYALITPELALLPESFPPLVTKDLASTDSTLVDELPKVISSVIVSPTTSSSLSIVPNPAPPLPITIPVSANPSLLSTSNSALSITSSALVSTLASASRSLDPPTSVSFEHDPDTVSLDSDDSSSEYACVLFMSGFPATATFSDIFEFIDEPHPDDTRLLHNQEGAFIGHLLKFISSDDAQHVLDKDGHWFQSRIISVSIHESDNESD